MQSITKVLGITRGSASVSTGPSCQTSPRSPYGRVSHCTVFISSLLPMGPLTYTHFFLLKKYQGKIKTDVVSTEAGYDSFCPGAETTGPLKEGGQNREVSSWVRNPALQIQRPDSGPCRGGGTSHHVTLQSFHGTSANEWDVETQWKNRPSFLINNPRQRYFPVRTPACISGKINTKTTCWVTMNTNCLSKSSGNITTYEHG